MSEGEKKIHRRKKRIETLAERPLPATWEKFLVNYVHGDMTQTQAAREVGFKNPGVSAVQMLNSPRVKERLEEMREELERKFGVTLAKSVRDLQKIRDEAWAEKKYSAAIKAEELRLKTTGLLVTRSHVTYQEVEKLSREQIMEKLQKYVDTAKKRMIDITPEGEDNDETKSTNTEAPNTIDRPSNS